LPQRFYIVDVFAQQRYAGNPLAVVVGADDLPDEDTKSAGHRSCCCVLERSAGRAR
jgi:predicted PhzF superfamily epimerase YddE/YHI9